MVTAGTNAASVRQPAPVSAAKLQLATRTLLNPGASQWAKVPSVEVPLGSPPLHLQPSRYVRTAWAGRPVGAVRLVRVQAAHNNHDIAFRLEWQDESENPDHGDGSVFPDAAAVVFPRNGDAPMESTGSAEAPVALWYWRANMTDGAAEELTGTGLGVFEAVPESPVRGRARWAEGVWRAVISAPLAASGPAKVGFAVWEGSRQERAGLMSYSMRWRDLEVR